MTNIDKVVRVYNWKDLLYFTELDTGGLRAEILDKKGFHKYLVDKSVLGNTLEKTSNSTIWFAVGMAIQKYFIN